MPASPLDIETEIVCRVGSAPISPVISVENHDEAYYVWRDAGLKNKTLVHVDAHHDMWWVADKAPITIANFICPALKENIVTEIFWVVPDATWDTANGRAAILRFLKMIVSKYPGAPQRPSVEKDKISTVVLGKTITACTLQSLPPIARPVLLDIDVDFMVIPEVTYGETDLHPSLPWCWPEELLARLASRRIRTDLVTIAYSVEGGYTPLKWKYLGDELASRLRQTRHCESAIHGFKSIRQASTAAETGDTAAAEDKYQEAARLLPGSAAPPYHLAHLYLKLGRLQEARSTYKRALELDSSYRSAYTSAGFRCYGDKQFREAEREHRTTLALHPEDPYAYLGLGQLAARKKRWKEAEELLQKSLELDEYLIDAYRELGRIFARQRRYDEAIEAYERSLQLALAGHKPISGPLLTRTLQPHILDPEHSLVHARLARVYMAKGAIERATTGYRMSAAGGCDRVSLRIALASLYLKQRQNRQAMTEIVRALKLIPTELKTIARSLRPAVRRFFSMSSKRDSPLRVSAR